MKIAIAGGTGFVGMALIEELSKNHEVIGLARNPPKESSLCEWRKTDFLSLLDAEKGLEGVEVAYYLVHSMMPSARLSQGRFQDFDLIAADNFARSAKSNGVKQIIYLGGLIPEGEELSPHLKSRQEVEEALAAYGTPVTVLRASLIVGAGGSSFVMVKKLVERLPAMICPKWTQTETQPIALEDVVSLLKYCLGNSEVGGHCYDIGGPDVLSYEAMMQELAKAMGKKIPMFHFPGFTVGLSRLWISVITGAPRSLVLPLIQSLKHRMVAKNLELQKKSGIYGKPFSEFVKTAVEAEKKRSPLQKPIAFVGNRKGSGVHDVSSVQRFLLPSWVNASWVAEEYLRWLPRFFATFLRVRVSEERVASFYLWPFPKPLLVLAYSRERSTENRALFYIKGGSLAEIQGRGRLEMREVLNRRYLLTAVLEFRPRLPWFFYRMTQARVHLWVMRAFGSHLDSIRKSAKP